MTDKLQTERRTERRVVSIDMEALEHLMFRAVRSGVESGFDHLLENPERIKAFWKKGFDELWNHGSNETKQWVGGALMKWLAGMLLVAALTLAVRFGGTK